MSKLTDEQIEAIYKQETGALIDDSPWALVDFSRAIEAAATEPLLQRIAELEKERDEWKHDALNGANAQYLREKNAELKRQLEEARNQALEEAAKVCDITPPQPFRPSIEAAHAIRALKGAKE